MSFYLDTSVLVPLHVEELRSATLRKWLEDAVEPALISDLAAAEFASAISRLIRMKAVTATVATQIMDDFQHWRTAATLAAETLPADIRSAAQLVRQPYPPLLTPDAIHLATCRRLNATLVADDADLLKAATLVGVPCLCPE